MKNDLLMIYKKLSYECNIKIELANISHTAKLIQLNIDFSFDNIDYQLKEIESKIKIIRKEAKRISLLNNKRKMT